MLVDLLGPLRHCQLKPLRHNKLKIACIFPSTRMWDHSIWHKKVLQIKRPFRNGPFSLWHYGFLKMVTPNIAAYRLRGKCQFRESVTLCDGYHYQQREFTAGCFAAPINQYAEIQTKGLFSPSGQKHFLIPQRNPKEEEILGWLED